MPRSLLALITAIALGTPAAADNPLPLGKFVEIEFTERDTPNMTIRGGHRGKSYVYPIEPGERFRIEAEILGEVDARVTAMVEKEVVSGRSMRFERYEGVPFHEVAARIDFTMAKAPPGRSVRITVASPDLCRARVRITKIGPDGKPGETTPPESRPSPTARPEGGDSLEERVRRLETENADLKRRLDALERRLGGSQPRVIR